MTITAIAEGQLSSNATSAIGKQASGGQVRFCPVAGRKTLASDTAVGIVYPQSRGRNEGKWRRDCGTSAYF